MDQMSRGFIIGATAGRTTLTGEGLQHADGHSPILGAMNPAMKIYDPAFGYEIAYIVKAGLEQMYGPDSTDRNWMYYLTVYNEPMHQPAEPDDVDAEGIVRGIHKISSGGDDGPAGVARVGGLRAVGAGGGNDPRLGMGGQRRRPGRSPPGLSCAGTAWQRRSLLLHPEEDKREPYVTRKLADSPGPIVASTDYVTDVPDQIRQFLPNPFATLGADEHGFSDTRAAAQRYFHIDTHSMVVRALQLLDTARSTQARPEAAAGLAGGRQRRHHRHGRRRVLNGPLSRGVALNRLRRLFPIAP